MIEHGNIVIRKKIKLKDLFSELENVAKDMGEHYKIAYGSIDAEGYFVGPHKLKIEDTEVILGINKLSSLRIHLGTRVGIIVCRNMERRITLLVVRKDEKIPNEDIDKVVDSLLTFTGGKFVANL